MWLVEVTIKQIPYKRINVILAKDRKENMKIFMSYHDNVNHHRQSQKPKYGVFRQSQKPKYGVFRQSQKPKYDVFLLRPNITITKEYSQ